MLNSVKEEQPLNILLILVTVPTFHDDMLKSIKEEQPLNILLIFVTLPTFHSEVSKSIRFVQLLNMLLILVTFLTSHPSVFTLTKFVQFLNILDIFFILLIFKYSNSIKPVWSIKFTEVGTISVYTVLLTTPLSFSSKYANVVLVGNVGMVSTSLLNLYLIGGNIEKIFQYLSEAVVLSIEPKSSTPITINTPISS